MRLSINTHESTGTTSDNDDEFAEVRGAVWKRVARIVCDCCVGARSKDGESLGNRQRQRVEVSDRIVLDAVHSRVLQRDHGIVEGGHGDRVYSVSWAGREEHALSTIVACGWYQGGNRAKVD